MEIPVTLKMKDINEERSTTVDFDMPTDCDMFLEQYGDEWCYPKLVAAMKAAVANKVRSGLRAGFDQAQCQEMVEGFDPNKVTRIAADPRLSAKKEFAAMSREEKEAHIEELRRLMG